MKLARFCQCQYSVEMKFIPSGSSVGIIGRTEEEYLIRHKTLGCPIKNHRIKERKYPIKHLNNG